MPDSTMPAPGLSVGLIGAGKMATALVQGWIRARIVDPGAIAAYDPVPSQVEKLFQSAGISRAPDNATLARERNLLLIATLPQTVPGILDEIAPELRRGQTIISIAPGVTLEVLERNLPEGASAVRVMPNTPALVGAGASAFSVSERAADGVADLVEKLLGAVGLAVQVPERLMDAVTGLSGSGPAYGFILIEALADGGVRAGLDRATALKLAAQTILGAARMVQETGEHPGRLKDQVASPGGTTIAGLGVLESRGVRGALMDAVAAAAARSAELGR